MKFGANRSQVYDAQKTARMRWDTTADVWNDAVRAEFESQVWEPLDGTVSELLRAVDQLSVLFTQVRHECEYQS